MTEPKKFKYHGLMLTQKEISVRTGISQSTLSNRIRSGMTAEEAVAQGINRGKATRRPQKAINTVNGKTSVKTGKAYRAGAQHLEDKFEMDSTGKWRLKWRYLSEHEVYKIKEICRKCTHAAMSGSTVSSCSYFDDTGHCRLCDPRDCKTLGFFEPKKRGPKPRRAPRMVL